MIAFPTLVISRRPRHIGGSGWDDAQSWFGGKPQLGRQPWPRGGARQTPFYFVAQIDLAEVGREVGRAGGVASLADGALAFFIGLDQKGRSTGAVVHVPRSELGESTDPPVDAPAVLDRAGGVFPSTFGPNEPRLFSFWPVDITLLDIEPNVSPDTDDEEDRFEVTQALLKAQVAAVNRLFTLRECSLTANEAFKVLGDAPRPFWWHSAQYYAACLRMDLDFLPQHIEIRRGWVKSARARLERLRPTGVTGVLSALGLRSTKKSPDVQKAEDDLIRCETSLAQIVQPAAEFERFVQDVEDWARGKDPWQFMPPEAVEEFKSIFERGKNVFCEFTQNYTPHFLDRIETETLLALVVAEDRAYATLPEAVRTLINTQYLLPAGYWHQMFGWGVDIQGAVWDYKDHVLLLQLVYDAMMHWQFGDVGAYQFWISPDDLSQGKWDAVRVTFEGH